MASVAAGDVFFSALGDVASVAAKRWGSSAVTLVARGGGDSGFVGRWRDPAPSKHGSPTRFNAFQVERLVGQETCYPLQRCWQTFCKQVSFCSPEHSRLTLGVDLRWRGCRGTSHIRNGPPP